MANILNSSFDLYNKLLDDHSAFDSNPLSTYKALNVAATAWHLTDWVFLEYERANYANVGVMREKLYLDCPELKIMFDLTTGYKHFTVSSPKSDMSGTHLHEGSFSREFSLEFDVSCLMVDFDGKESEPIEWVFDKVAAFWGSYFAAKGLAVAG